MATFSLGTGVTPGAPGVYINERPGAAAIADIASFSTVYMLVETPETTPVTLFPFNKPIPITTLADYRVLLGGIVPEERIPLLSYNCVNEFFQNAQVGDLRVVRVGTPNQIVEIEFFPSGSKSNGSSLPSALMAGDKVYVQMIINGIPLTYGSDDPDLSGFNANGEWLGVPVVIPVDYVANDEVNNRQISRAIVNAVAAAIETNPSVNQSVYIRNFGLVNEVDPALNSQNGYITIAASTFDGNVSVVTEVLPVGSQFVFMQNTYSIDNIVGQSAAIERVPADYTQCIATAFDGQQDQGYLITPTAYAQFDARGRAKVGAFAALHCESNDFKWMALADPGPYLVTDVNQYQNYEEHLPAENLQTGSKYLVDNAIYEWIGDPVTWAKATYQELSGGANPATAVTESVNVVADANSIGLLDSAIYTIVDGPNGVDGVLTLDINNYWPVDLPIQEVTVSGVTDTSSKFYPYNNQQLYVVAPPYDLAVTGDYSMNNVYLAATAADAVSLLNTVISNGGTINQIGIGVPGGALTPNPFTGSGDTASITYTTPFWDQPVVINGQESNLIENTSGIQQYFNTLHLPATLQSATENYRLNFVSRTLLNPSAQLGIYSGIISKFNNAATFTVVNHGLVNGQKVFFTQSITYVDTAGNTRILIKGTTKSAQNPYFVTVVDVNTFVLSPSITQFSTGGYVMAITGSIMTIPSVMYSSLMGGGTTAATLVELDTIPVLRERKYGFSTGPIMNEASSAAAAPTPSALVPNVQIQLNTSSVVLGRDLISPYGETINAGWLPNLELIQPGDPAVSDVNNFYCVPSVKQNYASEAWFVPSLEPIYAGVFDPTATPTIGPALAFNAVVSAGGYNPGTYTSIGLTGGSGTGVTANIIVDGLGSVSSVVLVSGGSNYQVGNTLTIPSSVIGTGGGPATVNVAVVAGTGGTSGTTSWVNSYGIANGSSGADLQATIGELEGTYFEVNIGAPVPGVTYYAPDGQTVIEDGNYMGVVAMAGGYAWVVQPSLPNGGDLSVYGAVLYGAQVKMAFRGAETPNPNLWLFDAITSTEIISDALRGIGFAGDPQAALVERGVDNVNALFDDSQRYFNPYGFIAYYGPYISNAAEQWIPPSPYVTGIAVRRYRAEGYQFPPAGVKYQLTDAVATQIPINSAQQNLLNPDGCNAIRTLPGYPQTAVFIWGGRTRVNVKDAQQRLYQFVNTRVILNVVYGSLRSAFDNQIFNVIDGFGVIFNQIIAVGNSILNQLYVKGALFGARPADAFQVICDNRINPPADLENGIVNAKVFVTPVPTLERIQIDLIRVAIGQMQKELNMQGLGVDNAAGTGNSTGF